MVFSLGVPILRVFTVCVESILCNPDQTAPDMSVFSSKAYPKDLDLSYKMDLDLLDCFGTEFSFPKQSQ